MKKIQCDDLTAFIDAYIDDEFDERDRADFEAHLAYCEACREEVDYQIAFKQQFKQAMQSTRERTPEHLKSNILSMLQQTSMEQKIAQKKSARKMLIKRAGAVALPAAAALTMALTLPAFTVAPASSAPANVASQAVDWHHGQYPLEVEATDPESVTSWFSDKVAFPVRLPKFSGVEAKLLGGRLAQIQDRRAALVLYELEDGSRMSVMMFDGQGIEVPGDRVKQIANRDVAFLKSGGYDVAVMQDRGLTYSMTSDLDEDKFHEVMKASLTR